MSGRRRRNGLLYKETIFLLIVPKEYSSPIFLQSLSIVRVMVCLLCADTYTVDTLSLS